MKTETITGPRVDGQYLRIEHPSGLTLMLCPMKGFSGAYALFSARCGSIDDSFRTSPQEPFTRVPEGIAHFLEHKLFESEEGDAFEQYARTGANANAYTSFDRTAYLFGCTDRFEESLEILVNLVTHPYFTEQTVEKEQGIIAQEIRMYDDSPDWRVFFNLLCALYHNHPLHTDIAGTVDSIREITAELLYTCYRSFYNLNNMVLAVAGNFDPDAVVRVCDKLLKPAEPVRVETRPIDEPEGVVRSYVEQTLEVAVPLFEIGFKGKPGTYRENLLGQAVAEIVQDVLIGDGSRLYRRLYDEGLINATFDSEVLSGPDYFACLFSGESHDPRAVFERILEGVRELRESGIDPEDFERARRAAYGRYVSFYGGIESMASILVHSKFAGFSAYELLETVADLTLEDAERCLRENFDPERAALSVINGGRS